MVCCGSSVFLPGRFRPRVAVFVAQAGAVLEGTGQSPEAHRETIPRLRSCYRSWRESPAGRASGEARGAWRQARRRPSRSLRLLLRADHVIRRRSRETRQPRPQDEGEQQWGSYDESDDLDVMDDVGAHDLLELAAADDQDPVEAQLRSVCVRV